jgi:hypothetical protein
MYCKYCGQKIDDDSTYCSGCGAKLSIAVKPESRRRAKRISKVNTEDTGVITQNNISDEDTSIIPDDNAMDTEEFEPSFTNILGQFTPFGKLVFIVLCLLMVVWVATLTVYIFYPEYISFFANL